MNRHSRYRASLDTPLGAMRALFDGPSLVALAFDESPVPGMGDVPCAAAASLASLRNALDAYFAGRATQFDVPLAPEGTPFQRAVWQALLGIPFGATASYAEIARRIGRPKAVRAVGAANARNPIAIIVPCHRVIGTDGSLTGYAGGLERKRALLSLEARGS